MRRKRDCKVNVESGNNAKNGNNNEKVPDGEKEEGSPLFPAQALGEEDLVSKDFFKIFFYCNGQGFVYLLLECGHFLKKLFVFLLPF